MKAYGGNERGMLLQCLVGQWQVQLILLYVKAIVWLQRAALVVTACTEIVDT